MELFGLGKVCARCRRLLTDGECASCAGSEDLTLTADIFASARGIEAPVLYDAADRVLSIALLAEFALAAAGTLLGSPMITVAMLVLMTATAATVAWVLPAMRQRHRLRLIMAARARALPPARWTPATPAGALTVTGTVRRIRAQVRGPLSGEPCMAAFVDVIVRDKLAAREVEGVDFLVVDDEDHPHIVAGTLWLQPCPSDLVMHTGEAELRIGDSEVLPARFRPAGVAHETRIHEGDRVTVCGSPTFEPYRELVTSYRDPQVTVLRGQPGSPVTIAKDVPPLRKLY